MKRIIAFIITITILASVCIFSASAATANAALSTSTTTVKPGDQFTLTVRVSSATKMGSVEGTLDYSSNIVEFVSGSGVNGASGKLVLSQWDSTGNGVSEFKFVITFKAKAEGSSSFTFKTTEISDVDFGSISNASGTAKISVQEAKPLSSNNYLKSLKLSSGTLSPAFSKSVLNYTVKVPNSTTTMLLTPTVEDSTATTKVTGSSNLAVGNNTRKVTVTAQNGSTRTYTITIVRAAADGGTVSDPPSQPPVSSEPESDVIYIEGVAMEVVEQLSPSIIPQGFAASVTKLGDKEVMSIINEQENVTMLYLKDPQGNTAFYIYNSTDISYYLYQPITVLGQNYFLMPMPSTLRAPQGFEPTDVTIGEGHYDGWQNSAFSDFYLLYLCNGKGETALYCYDAQEGTLQRYMGSLPSGNSQTTQQTTKPVIEVRDSAFGQYGLIVIIPLAAAFVAVTVVLIVLLATRSKKSKATASSPTAEDASTSFNDDFILK